MSNDEKWLDVGDISHLSAEFHELADEINDPLLYGLNHCKQVSFSFSMSERGMQEILNVLEEAKKQSLILYGIERLFKPLPHLD